MLNQTESIFNPESCLKLEILRYPSDKTSPLQQYVIYSDVDPDPVGSVSFWPVGSVSMILIRLEKYYGELSEIEYYIF